MIRPGRVETAARPRRRRARGRRALRRRGCRRARVPDDHGINALIALPRPRMRYLPTAAGMTIDSAYASVCTSPASVTIVTGASPSTRLSAWKASAVSSVDLAVELQPMDREEQLVAATQLELPPARTGANDARLGDQVARNRGATSLVIEIRERMLEMDRPQLAVRVRAQPVVEAKRVEVWRRTDLEHDVPRHRSRVECPPDQVELMLRGVHCAWRYRSGSKARTVQRRPRVQLGTRRRRRRRGARGRPSRSASSPSLVRLELRVRQAEHPRHVLLGSDGTGSTGARLRACRGSRSESGTSGRSAQQSWGRGPRSLCSAISHSKPISSESIRIPASGVISSYDHARFAVSVSMPSVCRSHCPPHGPGRNVGRVRNGLPASAESVARTASPDSDRGSAGSVRSRYRSMRVSELLSVPVLERPVDVDQLSLRALASRRPTEVRRVAAAHGLEREPLREVCVPELVVRQERASRPVDDRAPVNGWKLGEQIRERPLGRARERRIARIRVAPRACVLAHVERTRARERRHQRRPRKRGGTVDREHAAGLRRIARLDRASDGGVARVWVVPTHDRRAP